MEKVLDSLKIKKLSLKNRLVLPPMATNKANSDGSVNDEIISYYREITKGGYFSLVITEHAFVEENGRCTSNQLSVADDSKINGLSEIADAIHKNGSYAVLQINHSGSKGINIEENKAPSPVDFTLDTACKVKYWKSKNSLSEEEIKNITEKFKEAALRAEQAGFDGIELHSAHGFLLNQFYSSLTNKRNDNYGESIENRLRIHADIIKAIKDAVSDDFIIMLRLGALDYNDGGSTLEDAVKAAEVLEKLGIDILDISGGLCGYTVKGLSGAGYFGTVTSEIKKHISIPVILTGGINHIEEADQLLNDSKADLIGVGRAVLKDHEWAKKEFEK